MASRKPFLASFFVTNFTRRHPHFSLILRLNPQATGQRIAKGGARLCRALTLVGRAMGRAPTREPFII